MGRGRWNCCIAVQHWKTKFKQNGKNIVLLLLSLPPLPSCTLPSADWQTDKQTSHATHQFHMSCELPPGPSRHYTGRIPNISLYISGWVLLGSFSQCTGALLQRSAQQRAYPSPRSRPVLAAVAVGPQFLWSQFAFAHCCSCPVAVVVVVVVVAFGRGVAYVGRVAVGFAACRFKCSVQNFSFNFKRMHWTATRFCCFCCCCKLLVAVSRMPMHFVKRTTNWSRGRVETGVGVVVMAAGCKILQVLTGIVGGIWWNFCLPSTLLFCMEPLFFPSIQYIPSSTPIILAYSFWKYHKFPVTLGVYAIKSATSRYRYHPDVYKVGPEIFKFDKPKPRLVKVKEIASVYWMGISTSNCIANRHHQ